MYQLTMCGNNYQLFCFEWITMEESGLYQQAINDIVSSGLQKTINQMIAEFELVFEYVSSETINKLKMYNDKLNQDQEFCKMEQKLISDCLKPFEPQLLDITMSNKKFKSKDFDFMNGLIIFDGILSMELFNDENKNTKKALVNYLYTLYMTCSISQISDTAGNFTQELETFIRNTQKYTQQIESQQRPKRQIQPQPNVFDTLFQNKDIMNMASDISKDLQNQKVDPMTLMSSLLSGKPNAQLNNLVQNITSKLETKIQSGEIDKSALEQQAQNLMGQLNPADLIKQLGNLNFKK